MYEPLVPKSPIGKLCGFCRGGVSCCTLDPVSHCHVSNIHSCTILQSRLHMIQSSFGMPEPLPVPLSQSSLVLFVLYCCPPDCMIPSPQYSIGCSHMSPVPFIIHSILYGVPPCSGGLPIGGGAPVNVWLVLPVKFLLSDRIMLPCQSFISILYSPEPYPIHANCSMFTPLLLHDQTSGLSD